ncbi:hypothetical protein [Allonocardiopsis opalescens]|nr:hypothetical protein [Allonocardiopsis opalescens]
MVDPVVLGAAVQCLLEGPQAPVTLARLDGGGGVQAVSVGGAVQ